MVKLARPINVNVSLEILFIFDRFVEKTLSSRRLKETSAKSFIARGFAGATEVRGRAFCQNRATKARKTKRDSGDRFAWHPAAQGKAKWSYHAGGRNDRTGARGRARRQIALDASRGVCA